MRLFRRAAKTVQEAPWRECHHCDVVFDEPRGASWCPSCGSDAVTRLAAWECTQLATYGRRP